MFVSKISHFLDTFFTLFCHFLDRNRSLPGAILKIFQALFQTPLLLTFILPPGHSTLSLGTLLLHALGFLFTYLPCHHPYILLVGFLFYHSHNTMYLIHIFVLTYCFGSVVLVSNVVFLSFNLTNIFVSLVHFLLTCIHTIHFQLLICCSTHLQHYLSHSHLPA